MNGQSSSMSVGKRPHKFAAKHLFRSFTSRRFRFSLRGFLILVGLFCLTFGWYASTVYRQRHAVLVITELAGACHYDDEHRFQPSYKYAGSYRTFQRIRIEPEQKSWLRRMLGDDWFADITYVYFSGKHITNKELVAAEKALRSLPKLKRLCLKNTAVDHRALKYLESVKQLHVLDLQDTPICMDDAGMVELQRASPDLKISFVGY